MLKISNVETFYGKIQALRGVDLDVNDGEIVSLIGSNGAGKSTLLMTISGVNKARRGKIVFNGEKEAVRELERNFRIDENIIRFLTSKADSIPSEPTPIMKYKIEKENAESYANEINLETNES